MTRKNGKKGSRKNGNNGANSSKSLIKRVSKIVDAKLDAAIEDKYLRDSVFNQHNTSYDSATNTLLFNISPAIAKGDGVNQRAGNKVKLKYLRSFVRMRPGKFHAQHNVDGTPSYTANWIPHMPKYRCFLIKVNNELAVSLTSSEMRQALNAKFRSPGHFWQDYAQDVGKKAVSGIKLLHKFEMTPKWKQLPNTFTLLNQTGSVSLPTTIMDGTITLTPDYAPSNNVISVPQYSYYELFTKEVAQKVEISNADNGVMRYQYWMFVQNTNGYQDTTYDSVVAPESFEIRNCWVYEDA